VDDASHGTAERLEMVLVARWLDAGQPDDGRLSLRLDEALDGLDLAAGREGLMTLMAALGALESRGALAVAWPKGITAGEAEVTLSADLRRDAARLFGG
jgi:hypothetical protein